MGFFRSRKPKADDRWASGAFAETSGDGGIGETSLTVAVRSRPLLPDERRRGDRRDIVRVLDDKHIVVLDPDDEKNYLDERTHRTKERRYTFDKAFGSSASNRDVYQKTARALISGVLNGQNGTVFAYGATGSGKTYTMIGTRNDPGMMPLSLMDIFDAIRSMSGEYTFEVTCSYLEVYNELIYDLLVNNSPSLDLREDPERGATVPGLRRISVTNADNVLDVLREGNARRKTEPTEANAVSSRSHAVMEINVRRFSRVHPTAESAAAGGGGAGSGGGGGGGGRMEVLTGRLSLVDLAGSERASETKNEGSKLRDGANINRSLLALANCINALGKKQQGAGVYVPFRNSKLTRLLKDGLVGNSRTAMVANVSCGNDQYNHTINTLKYADRAKEIKTNVRTNVVHVATHPGEAQRVIEQLQDEVAGLKRELKAARSGGGAPRLSFFGGGKTKTGAAPPAAKHAGEHPHHPAPAAPNDDAANENSTPATTVATTDREGPNEGIPPQAPISNPSAIDDAGVRTEDVFDDRWLEKLSVDVHENTEERINLQRALFELEDVAIQSRCELASVEDRLVELEMTGAAQIPGSRDKSEAESLRDRRRRLADGLREGENAARRDRAAMDANEGKRREIQSRIDRAAEARESRNGGKLPAFLRILSQYRTRGVSSMEAHFQLAVRDGVLADQRDVIGCMWRMLAAAGVSRERAVEAAKREGVFAAYDGCELNLGEDNNGWSTYSLERETVVGARAAARLAFWQSYGAVDDLSVGTGKHPHVPAPASEHHHHHQHQGHQHQSNHPQHHPRDHQREHQTREHQTREPPKRGGADPDPTAALLAAAAATLAKSPRAAVPDPAPMAHPTQLSPRDRSARAALAKLRDRGGSGRRKSVESIQYSEGSRPVSSSGVSASQVSDSAYSGQTSRNLSARGDTAGRVDTAGAAQVQTAYARVDKEEEVRAGFIPTQGKRGAPPIAASAYKTLAVGGTRASLGSRPASGGGGGGGAGGGGGGRRLAGRLRSPPQPTERAFGMADAGPKPETPVAYVMRP